MKETFDVAIVGAGPAGIAAACTLAGAGIKTIVFERGEYPGAKNVSGGVLYGHDLAQVVPDFAGRDCPIERNIVEARVCYLSADGGYTLAYRDAIFSGERKHNAFTVARARFDRWFAGQARGKGALIAPATTVVDLLRDGHGGVAGVVTGREDGEVRAKVTLLADGVNSALAAATGFRPELKPEEVALAVKEIIELPAEVIEQRFGVAPGDGVTLEILGEITAGMDGVAALYTNHGSLSLSIGANLADFAARQVKPYELIEAFKQHPVIAPLITDGQVREYLAHWLAEGGYDSIPRLYGDGYLIAGDSAMLFNALHREGNNLAMASGKMAAETIIEALGKGDLSRKGLAGYGERLAGSYVMRDLKKYRSFGKFLYNRRELFNELPGLAAGAAREMLTVDGVSKKQKQKVIVEAFRRRKMSLWKLLRLAWRMWRVVK
ncbi:MAG TPA: FAD-dependent oxidoreductase [Dehalococcoidales bacterium]|nr:FAD-dependent oxidoreductase [Dehalococcoidales bacterium]